MKRAIVVLARPRVGDCLSCECRGLVVDRSERHQRCGDGLACLSLAERAETFHRLSVLIRVYPCLSVVRVNPWSSMFIRGPCQSVVIHVYPWSVFIRGHWPGFSSRNPSGGSVSRS